MNMIDMQIQDIPAEIQTDHKGTSIDRTEKQIISFKFKIDH